jgi:chromosome segregation ATPase
MGFMQKNVNIFILVLVLALAGALAASSAYYQTTFDKLTGRYDDTATNLSQCHSDLENYRFNLNKTLSSLNTTAQDIRRYDELYSTKATELQTTQTELNETASTLQGTRIQLQEEAALKEKYKDDYEDQVEISHGLEEQNAILTSQKAQLESSVISYRSKVESANDCIDEFLADYDAGLTQAMKDAAEGCKQ